MAIGMVWSYATASGVQTVSTQRPSHMAGLVVLGGGGSEAYAWLDLLNSRRSNSDVMG